MFGQYSGSRVILFFLFVSSLLVYATLIDPGSWPLDDDDHPSLGHHELAPRSIAKNVPLRILCLGASITYGYRSSGGNGYRYSLRGKLIEQGNDVNMIGSLRAGNMSNNHVEGWRGYRISQIAKKAELSLQEMPNVVLIIAGTNDMRQNHKVSTAPLRMGALIDRILKVVPGTTIIVAKLPPNSRPSTEANIQTFNANLNSVVSNRTVQGKKVSLVDMHSDWFSLADLGPDGTHPTDMGYLKIAKVFYTGIMAVAANISAPATVKGIDDYMAGNDSSIAGSAMDVVCDSRKGQTMGFAERQQCSSSSRMQPVHIYFALSVMIAIASII